MEDKKYLKISLGMTICIFIIFILIIGLVCLGFYTYKLKSTDSNAIVGNENTSALFQNMSGDNLENMIANESTDIGEEININDSVVKTLANKINFNTYAIASIYKVGAFNLNNIPNDLILRLGWDKIDSSNKSNLYDVLKQTATKDVMKQSITNIFGTKVKYTDNSFDSIDVEKFHDYAYNNGTIEYSNSLYTANIFQGGGGDAPFIHQEIQKVLKYNNKIEVYVKTVFIDTEYSDSLNDFYYIMYKNFNFTENRFEEQLTKTEARENEYAREISLESNSEISKISSKLNTYVYTFELDNITGEYYLSGFAISK